MSENIFWMVSKAIVNAAAEQDHRDADQRRGNQAEQRQPPVDRQHHADGQKSAVNKVSVKYMMPGPSIMRTALRSLVARAMMSPVRYFA